MAEKTLSIPKQQTLKEKASGEFRRLLVIFLYLWVVFGMLSIHKSIILSQYHLDTEEHAFAIINAFVFAKVLLVGEHFNLGTRFRSKPLIYPILYKCLVFTVLMIVFHVIESVAVGLWRGRTIAESLPPFLGWNPKGLLAVGVTCFVLLMPFFGFREVAHVIGRRELRALLLEPRSHDPRLT
ncbi:MAG TPA: hypothetical protein VHT28_12800 [Silvibacterium sp.]|jgi:hypothetical protein|nr:hypothetical protein [Silvibacterium sp.]